MLTAPQSLMTRTFWGSCCPSVREMLVLCITVLLAPGLGAVWAEATVDMSGMFLWVASCTCVSGPSLTCAAAFRRCCNICCWFCWGCFHCWVGPGLGACCCWVRPLDICRRVLTLGPGAGVWAPSLGGARALGYGPVNGWFENCGALWVDCLCCWGCCCSWCCWGGSGSWCGVGCGVACDGAGLLPGVWEFSLSSNSLFLTPACICRRISFFLRISSLRRFCSSIFKRYCRVSSSSSGFCVKEIKAWPAALLRAKWLISEVISQQSREKFNSIDFLISNGRRPIH